MPQCGISAQQQLSGQDSHSSEWVKTYTTEVNEEVIHNEHTQSNYCIDSSHSINSSFPRGVKPLRMPRR